MKRIILLLILLNVFQNMSFAQDKKKIDSLQTVLRTAKEDTNKVNTLIGIARRKGLRDN